MVVISAARDFRDASTSAMEGSDMAGVGAAEGDGGGLVWWVAAVED